ncbi:MAG: 3-deoxy-7-phosphoheptulonate synthase [Candidatus Caldatribacterium sp.]|uniref:3-deoxy-7-phosphoheptulonate synthase n=1 Tax=Candidatus Caldatribacterium sp. TaxID=2282143 RepID=UPI00299CA03F|nr:3-deoxy-7-phosphoheptulonate synthase [Candidatus Caldatribacterium sp.]MCX7731121.1 3-deoxy-7-phosphoheptulonate synthase [Candidatus Caldatribacterium sp.]MDW8081184.1 3-deoxy-7-phosphoheptulonate synthase [Candidatus Calescibacterium sp.]
MIIVLRSGVTQQEIEEVVRRLKRLGFGVHISQGVERTIVGAIGDERGVNLEEKIGVLPFVERVIPILTPYKLTSREFREADTVVRVGDVEIGPGKFVVIAGPCAIESEAQIIETARRVKEAGAKILRGGAFKPRTSPYSFQGLGEEGLRLLAKAREETGLPFVTEALGIEELPLVAEYADMIQIGARNMQNFRLLEAVGRLRKPVLLKRGMMNTVDELLMSAEYILAQGNYQVVLCERGIRTFEPSTRNTLDLSCVPLVKKKSHLPIIVDPSHGTGRSELVTPMSLAALACGADGLIVEVHPNPIEALSDGPQSLTPDQFATLMKELRKLAIIVGREM